MVWQGTVYSPATLEHILAIAKSFLKTAPGPNRKRRSDLAEKMFSYWEDLAYGISDQYDRHGSPYTKHDALVRFEEVQSRGGIERARINFSAGAEGHLGHRVLFWQMKKPPEICNFFLGEGPVVLGLEQDTYFSRPESGKARPAPFLPLPVRFSMWAWYPYVDIVTVLPEKPPGEEAAGFYNRIFEELVGGSEQGYFFAPSNDPLYQEKVRRGRGNVLSEVMRHRCLVVDSVNTPSTTFRVTSLMSEVPLADIFEEIAAFNIRHRDEYCQLCFQK